MEKCFIVVYLSPARIHHNFRCYCKTKRQARKLCRDSMGVGNADIVEVYEENPIK